MVIKIMAETENISRLSAKKQKVQLSYSVVFLVHLKAISTPQKFKREKTTSDQSI